MQTNKHTGNKTKKSRDREKEIDIHRKLGDNWGVSAERNMIKVKGIGQAEN